MEVEVSQYYFELEDMSNITPFWQWLDRRVQPKWIYTVPDDFEAILNGQKKADADKFLVIGEPSNEVDSSYAIPCTYSGQTLEIITVIAQRLSDHRFKIELSFWEPEGWPKNYLWDIFNDLLTDLSLDYPDAKKSLRKSILGFDDEDFDDTQKSEMIGSADYQSMAIENTNIESEDSLLDLYKYLKACIEWADRPYLGGREIYRFLSSTFGTDSGYPVVSKGRFYRFLQKALELELIKKEGRYYKLAFKTRAEALKQLDYIIQNWNSIRTK